jgi:ubiquinone/menaquinone biosynthesis C-methylase UbiE
MTTPPSPLTSPATWDNVADGYAADFLPIFSMYARDAWRLAGSPSRAHVLDVATGPGTLPLLLAREAERVVAMDFSPAMLEILCRRVAAENIASIEVRQGDGQSLPFQNGIFDAAFSLFGLMFFPDRAAGFRELARVLRPGCPAVVTAWAPLDGVPLLRFMFQTLHALLPGVAFGKGKAPLSDPDEFRAEMETAGFRSVEIQTLSHTWTAPSVQVFWEAQVRSSAPVALLKKGLAPEEWKVASSVMEVRLLKEFGPGPLDISWPAHFGVGRKAQ